MSTTRPDSRQSLGEDSFTNLAPNKIVDLSIPLQSEGATTLDITINHQHQVHTVTGPGH